MGENDFWRRFYEWWKTATPEDQRFLRKFSLTLRMSDLVWRQREFYTGRGRGKLTKEQVKELKREYAQMLTPHRKPGRPKGAITKKGSGKPGDRRKPYVDLWLKGVRKPEYYRHLEPKMTPEEFQDFFDDNLCRTFRRWDKQAANALAAKKRNHLALSFMRPKRTASSQQPPALVN